MDFLQTFATDASLDRYKRIMFWSPEVNGQHPSVRTPPGVEAYSQIALCAARRVLAVKFCIIMGE